MEKISTLIVILLSFFMRVNSQVDYAYKFSFNDKQIALIDTFKNNGSGKIDIYNKNESQIATVKIVVYDSIAVSLEHERNVSVELEKKQVESSIKLKSDNFKFYVIKIDKQTNNVPVARIEFAYSKKFEIYDLLIVTLLRHISYKKISLTISERS